MELSEIKQSIQKHWDANVCDYNKGSDFHEIDAQRNKAYPYLRKELKLAGDTGKEVLEIGVGSASDACTSLLHAKPKRYVLVDLSPRTLEVAKQHLDEHCAGTNYEFVNRDAADLSCFPDNSFDRVKALGSLHHIPDAEKVIMEIGRVLKPGGDAVFMFYNKDSFRVKYAYPYIAKKTNRTVESLINELDGGSNPFTKLYSKKEVRDICWLAGIKVTRFRTYHLGHEERKRLGLLAWYVERTMGFALYVNGYKKPQEQF